MLPDRPRTTVLGPVRIDGADPGGPLARALVAALALRGGDGPCSVSALTDGLWGDEPPQNPRPAMQSLVARTRAACGSDCIATHPGGYTLGTGGSGDDESPRPRSDLELARSLADRAEGRLASGEDQAGRLELIDRALGLWRGTPGEDLGSTPVAAELAGVAAILLARLRLTRARTLRALGRPEEAVAELTGPVDRSPFDERLHEELMTALSDAGRPHEAIALYARFRERLREELGSSPGAGIAEANARLLREQEAPRAERVRIGVHAELGELFGRDEDLAAVAEALRRRRLVTILGAGGLGKTRLAQAVAGASDEPVVAVVPLAGVRADGDVLPAIAAALGVSESTVGGRLSDARPAPGLRDRVLSSLGESPTLLVLDNCEQVIRGVAAWTADALASTPRLRVLATSRTPLAIAAETVFPLDPLGVESAEGGANAGTDGAAAAGPAVRLFVERARAVRPGARLDAETAARLCARLDGLPLAIELAAARVRTMTPEQIETRLEDRFALLVGGDRTAPDRHRTLEAVIDWSWELLDDESRAAMAALSLLPGGFSAETAAGVLAANDPDPDPDPGGGLGADEVLDRLVAQSLLIVVEDPVAGVRFRMLETVREFGIARLQRDGLEGAAWDALRAWARGFVLALGPRVFGLPGSIGPEAFRVIGSERDNLLAALRRSISERRELDVVIVFAVLAQSGVVRGAHTELFGIGTEAVDVIAGPLQHGVPVDALAMSLFFCAIAMLVTEDPRALRLIARLRILCRGAGERVHPLWSALSRLIDSYGDPLRSPTEIEALRRSPDAVTRMIGELLLSQVSENDGEPALGMSAAKRAWRLAEDLREPWFSAMAASSIAQLASQAARPDEALEWLDRATAGLEAYGAEDELRERGWLRGMALVSLGRPEEARPLFEALVRGSGRSQEAREGAAVGWHGLAEVARAEDRPADARAAYERSLVEFGELDQRAAPWYLVTMAGFVSAACFDGLLPPDEIARRAARMRARVIATHRMRPEFVDRPILGTVLCGWSAWALTVPRLRARGLEALALAETLGARQDHPSLHLEEHYAHAAAIVGADGLAAARAAASGLAAADRVPRALETLAAPDQALRM